MFVQTQKTPNPNSLKFLPGKKVSNDGAYEFLNKEETENYFVRNILSINGVTGIFLSEDFLSVNKLENEKWENIQHIIISYINEYYSEGNEFIIDKPETNKNINDYGEIEKKIIKILETKVRPAVAKDGGDITFKGFKDGKVTVMLKGSCSGCPSSTLTLKQGVQNLLTHYIPEVKEVLAV
jgi:Thioredoxin-like proteins and domains|tara:strand:+ start:134 stop:676 length:543 start_codon:yes stop_codon:yes gene_type:complete